MNSFMKAQSHVGNEFLSNLFEKKKPKNWRKFLFQFVVVLFRVT